MRLITPPLPAASRPSKMASTFQTLVLDPVLHFDQLDLQAGQLFFVDLVFDLAGFRFDVAMVNLQRRSAIGSSDNRHGRVGNDEAVSLELLFLVLLLLGFHGNP